MINRWRYVEYKDDGVSEYQCLACGNRMYLAESPEHWTYCPYCGTKWYGEHKCRRHSLPRWQYEKWGENGKPYVHGDYSPEWFAEQKRREDDERVWVILERTRFNNNWLHWKLHSIEKVPAYYQGTQSSWIKHTLDSLRNNDGPPDEDPVYETIYRCGGIMYRLEAQTRTEWLPWLNR